MWLKELIWSKRGMRGSAKGVNGRILNSLIRLAADPSLSHEQFRECAKIYRNYSGPLFKLHKTQGAE